MQVEVGIEVEGMHPRVRPTATHTTAIFCRSSVLKASSRVCCTVGSPGCICQPQ